jgi:hypothetical protein
MISLDAKGLLKEVDERPPLLKSIGGFFCSMPAGNYQHVR